MLDCPRCRRPLPAGAAGCPACGARLSDQPGRGWGLRWVAEPPRPGPHVPARPVPAPPRPPYSGPPAYLGVPRWGFPLLGWRRPAPIDGPRVSALDRARALAASMIPLLWLTAVLSLTAAVTEGWRYALLLASRTDAVSAGPLRVSDVLVGTFGGVAVLAAGLTWLVGVLWAMRIYEAAAAHADRAPARPSWQVVVGLLVPGVNLVLPPALLAEAEHAASRRDPTARPRPSRRLVVWSALWAAGVLLVTITLLNRLRDGAQAQADGVLLHVGVDLVAAAVAVATVGVVRSLTASVAPISGRPRRMVVLRVGPASTRTADQA